MKDLERPRGGIYDPWNGTWCDYPPPPVEPPDTPGAAMVVAITGVFCIISFGLWWVL